MLQACARAAGKTVLCPRGHLQKLIWAMPDKLARLAGADLCADHSSKGLKALELLQIWP